MGVADAFAIDGNFRPNFGTLIVAAEHLHQDATEPNRNHWTDVDRHNNKQNSPDRCAASEHWRQSSSGYGSVAYWRQNLGE